VVLAQASDGVGHIVAELDLEHQRELRAQLPALANRRPDAYRWPEERSQAAAQGAAR
jgi:predicted amidohydrolase